MGNLPETEKSLRVESGRAGAPSANPGAEARTAFARRAGDSVAAGRSPTSRPWGAPLQLELLGRPAPCKVFLPRLAQKLLPRSLPGQGGRERA